MRAGRLWFAACAIAAIATPMPAVAQPGALDAAQRTFAKIDDYSTVVTVHETDGKRVEDRTYHVLFKKPSMERVDIVAGPGKGGGIVWMGGDKVKGHRGGILSGIRLTLDLHNGQVTTLRGDTVDTATIPSMLAVFTLVKGEVSEAAGPSIDGGDTSAITLEVAEPEHYGGVTREVLYLSESTHLPVRRERFSGTSLVKSENVTEMKTNTGLSGNDFPW